MRLLRPGGGIAGGVLRAVADASFALAASTRGALVVIARRDPVEPLLSDELAPARRTTGR